MPVLSHEERHVALGLLQGGMSCRDVAKRMNCHHSTVARLVERYKATASVRSRRRGGQPRVATKEHGRHIVLLRLRNKFQNATQKAANTIGRRGPVDPGTVRNRL